MAIADKNGQKDARLCPPQHTCSYYTAQILVQPFRQQMNAEADISNAALYLSVVSRINAIDLGREGCVIQ